MTDILRFGISYPASAWQADQAVQLLLLVCLHYFIKCFTLIVYFTICSFSLPQNPLSFNLSAV
jgi:hypothetical protein